MEPDETVTVSLWWEDQPDRPHTMGKLSRIQLALPDSTITGTKPAGGRAIEARTLAAHECPNSSAALKLFGYGVFALHGEPVPHRTSRTMDVCAVPVATARDLVSALRRAGWIK